MLLLGGPAGAAPLASVSIDGALIEAKGPERVRSLLACGDVSGVVDILSSSLVGDVAGLPNMLVGLWSCDALG